MKAAEVLRLYEKGERDFKGVSLRGQNFKGRDLSGADFSAADIRSANFTNANLVEAKLIYAQAGLNRWWSIGLTIFSLLTSTIAGFFSAFGGYRSSLIFSSGTLETQVSLIFSAGKLESQVSGWIALIILILLYALIFLKGINSISFVSAVAFAVFVSILFAIAIAIAYVFAGEFVFDFAATFAISFAFSFAGAVVGAVAGAFSIGSSGLVAGPLASIITGLVAILFTIVFSFAFVFEIAGMATFLFASALGVLVSITSSYVGLRAFGESGKDSWVKLIVIAFSSIGGTSFRKANLTNSDFTKAILKGADFRQAILFRTRWKYSIRLNRSRPGNSYLNSEKIQQLLSTGNGKDQDFNGLIDMAGINLEGASLENANFSEVTLKDASLKGANLEGANLTLANLNYSNLQDANLSCAKLVQAQLDYADLTGATLTGAIIEDWGITTATKLYGIQCKYVFMHVPSPDDPEPRRKPDDRNREFTDGEFVDFIAPMIETLDLYHNQSVDPRAIAIAFHELREQNPNANLNIISMEKRGKNRDKLLLRAETNPQADLSELNSQYFERYDHLLSLPPKALQALLIEKDKQVKILARMVDTAIERPSQTFINQYNNQGDVTVSEQGSNAPKYDMRGAQFAGGFAETVEGNMEGGTINNAAAETPSLAEAAAEIQDLLKQLEQTAPAETMTEKMTLATQAIAQIESNPTLKQRAVAALTAGGMKAFEKAIDHPVAAFVVGAIEEWKKS